MKHLSSHRCVSATLLTTTLLTTTFLTTTLATALLATPRAAADPPRPERIRRARAAVDARPGDLETQLRLVMVLMESDRPADALVELDVLDALAPREPRTPLWRARALVALGRHAEAEDTLRRTSTPAGWTLRGQLREERGALDLALEDYLRALTRRPTLEVELAAARVLERLGRATEAWRRLEAAAHRTPSVLVRAEAIRLARQTNHPEAALAHVDALVARAPTVRWWVLRAELLTDLARPAEATEALAAAQTLAEARVRRRPSAQTLTDRARVRLAQGRLVEARDDLERAVRLAPSWTPPRQLLNQLGSHR